MTIRSAHSGYIFLVSVLVIGAIAATTTLSLLLLGWAAEQNGLLAVQSHQALENAHTCAERALLALRKDPSYGGDETFQLARGSCTVKYIGGNGNENRTVCVEGANGLTVERMEMAIVHVFPSITFSSWQNVADFSLCP
ncbi:MAG TPA: hypothetical protein VHA78_02135 [Candidatus Peribacteraceae bacterium]|nr:hypothetical protein [Candidatus Peribacteraceae bacterium]